MLDEPSNRSTRAILVETRPPLWLLMLFAVMSPLSLLLFFPALPPLAQEFGVELSSIQWVITGFLIGVGSMQLVIGPLVDRVGRRTVVLAGLVLFVMTSACAATVSDARLLIGLRIAQALCVASLSVVSRATVRDIFTGSEAGRAMSFITLALQLPGPIAPAIAGALVVAAGWESLFVLLAGIGGILLVLSFWFLPETRPETGEPVPRFSSVLSDYARLVRNPAFSTNAAIVSLTAAAAMTLLTVVPAALTDLFAKSPDFVGYATSAYSLVSITGALAASHLVTKIGVGRLMSTVLLAVALYLSSYLLWTTLSSITMLNLFIAVSVVGFGQSIIISMGFARAIEADDELRGTASGLTGAVSSIVSAAFAAAGATAYASGLSMSLAVVFLCFVLSTSIASVRILRGRKEHTVARDPVGPA